MTGRECRFCFVPAMAALCSGQAAFKCSCSQGSRLQIKPVWKTRGETKLERSPGAAPKNHSPAGETSGAGQSRSGRGVQEPGRALPRASSKALFPSARKKSDGGSRDAQEASEACFLLTSCMLPAHFPRTPPDGTLQAFPGTTSG